MSAIPESSQTMWDALDTFEDVDFDELDRSIQNNSTAKVPQEEETESLSQHSSFSIDPVLEKVMLEYKEPVKLIDSQAATLEPPTNSASTSATVADISDQENALFESFSTRVAESVTSSVVLGKRRADSSISLGEPTRKSRRQDEPAALLDSAVIVAQSSRSFQKWVDARALPWGIQWELARLVSNESKNVKYEQVTMAMLDELKKKGNNKEGAPLVESLLLGEKQNGWPTDDRFFEEERKSKSPWEELDIEDERLAKDCYAGLGFNQNSDWFGGKVIFRARLKNVAPEEKPPEFKLELDRPELGASSRLTRRFGSNSFMRAKIPKTLAKFHDELMVFLRKPFIVAGKVFRAFLEKDRNVFFYMTNEKAEPGFPVDPSSKNFSFFQFLNWHNPIDTNREQTAAKFASRYALGLSTSAPGLLVHPRNIYFIDDIVSSNGSDMTDGAGLINKTALRQLNYKFEFDNWPTAIQCRIAGAKGMLLLHPSDDSPEPRVWIRKSMNKIQYPDLGSDQAYCVIDVLRSCHPRFGSHISPETIINLAANGVPKSVFTSLLDQTLDSLIASLTTWDTLKDLQELWRTLAKLGGVFAARSARVQTGMARVQGFSERDPQENDDEDGLEEEQEHGSIAWWGDEVSGQPSSLEETVMRLLDGGFTPRDCPVMLDKLKRILITQIDHLSQNYRIAVPMSFTAFIVPDPEGVLEEGEIYFKSSRRGILLSDGQYTDVLTGPVVVTRHPCKLPTDAQKWIAVDKPELRHYTDVMLISIKGRRRGADWLGGGDYDGDKALGIYQPEIVNSFQNADRELGDPRDDIKAEAFKKETESMSQLLDRAPDGDLLVHALQEYLLGGIKVASYVGQASNMHDYLLYTKGLDDPETIRMAHIFCHTLDGLKTGLRIKEEIWKRDLRLYDRGSMGWKETAKKSVARTDNLQHTRPQQLGRFIMDDLETHAKAAKDRERTKLDDLYDSYSVTLDEVLAAPWNEAEERAQKFTDESGSNLMEKTLENIKEHVEKMREAHRKNLKEATKKSNTKKFTDLSIETRQDILRSLSREFQSNEAGMKWMSREEISRLKASYAYIHDYEKDFKKWTRFPWDVAMRDLTAIKANAAGRSTTVGGDYYSFFTLRKPY